MKFKESIVADKKVNETILNMKGALSLVPLADIITATSIKNWYENKKPFVNLYPVIEKALTNTHYQGIKPGNIQESIIHKLGCLEVRTGVDSPVPNFMISLITEKMMSPYAKWSGKSKWILRFLVLRQNGVCIYTTLAPGTEIPAIMPLAKDSCSLLEDFESNILRSVTAIAIGLMMLASDPEYFVPILLNKDKHKILDPDAYDRAVNRAKNRGVYGFNVGKDIEVAPHVRRPHFGIRWTGPGRKIPKLSFIKGSIINKKLLEKVPTGYDR